MTKYGLAWAMRRGLASDLLDGLDPETIEVIAELAAQRTKSPNPRRGGRPKNAPDQNVDVFRARVVDWMKSLPELKSWKDTELIHFAARLERARGPDVWNMFGLPPRDTALFDDRMRTIGSLRSSISNGRKLLKNPRQRPAG